MKRNEMLGIRYQLQIAVGEAGGDVTGAGTDLRTGKMDIGFKMKGGKRYKVTLKELVMRRDDKPET